MNSIRALPLDLIPQQNSKKAIDNYNTPKKKKDPTWNKRKKKAKWLKKEVSEVTCPSTKLLPTQKQH